MYPYGHYVISSVGEVEFQRAVPDTLTTWVASAFAVSNTTGLGVGELKPQVSAFCVCKVAVRNTIPLDYATARYLFKASF